MLNINPGTVLLGYLLFKLGVDIEFKISVFMGNDNPYAALWTLIGAKLFAREDGTSPLIGFNWSNSVNNETIEITAEVRKALGFEDVVRFEHHITETYKSIVRQPYNRRDELVEVAARVANLSAKHEGGDPEIDAHARAPVGHPGLLSGQGRGRGGGRHAAPAAQLPGQARRGECHGAGADGNGLAFVAAPRLHHQVRVVKRLLCDGRGYVQVPYAKATDARIGGLGDVDGIRVFYCGGKPYIRTTP